MRRFVGALFVVWLASVSFLANAFAEDSAKLDQVLQNQQDIMAKLDQIIQELQIVKVRASQK